MIFRVRWWLESYEETRIMFDRVNTTLQKVYDANGIDTPYIIQTTKLQAGGQIAQNLSQAFREQPTDG